MAHARVDPTTQEAGGNIAVNAGAWLNMNDTPYVVGAAYFECKLDDNLTLYHVRFRPILGGATPAWGDMPQYDSVNGGQSFWTRLNPAMVYEFDFYADAAGRTIHYHVS